MKNNKGFTLIELLLGLSLFAIVIIPVFVVIVGFKNKEIFEANKTDLNNFKANIMTTIEEDIINKGVAYICNNQEKIGANTIISDSKYRIIYQDNSFADLSIEATDGKKNMINYITYTVNNSGTITKKDEQTFIIPVKGAIIENIDYIKENLGFSDDDLNDFGYLFVYKDKILYKTATILKIMIPITYEKTDYSMAITTTFISKIPSNNICRSNYPDGEIYVLPTNLK